MQIIRKKVSKRGQFLNLVIQFCEWVVVLLAVILSSPLLLVIALCIKLDDAHGSVIYSQKRIGKEGVPFVIYKFRSMSHGSENKLSELVNQNEMSGHMFKMKKDPRVTRVGAILRRLSLDELPQLFNVLKGDMSLVGPRPALASEYQKYTAYERQRTQVKPGCTGLWQVSGRNKLTFDEMVKLDLVYIENRSVLLNVKIVLRTFKEFTHKGSGY